MEKGVFKSQEISHRETVKTRYAADEILQVISKHFGISFDELIERKGVGGI